MVGIPGIPAIPDMPDVGDPLDARFSSDAIGAAERLRAARLRGVWVPDDGAAAFLAMLFSFGGGTREYLDR